MDHLLKRESRIYLINSCVFLVYILALVIWEPVVAEGQGLFKQLNAQQIAKI
jgi:hypothetical protein